jgi:hypothetical protein
MLWPFGGDDLGAHEVSDLLVTFGGGVLIAQRRSGRRVPAPCHYFLRRHPRFGKGAEVPEVMRMELEVGVYSDLGIAVALVHTGDTIEVSGFRSGCGNG